MKLSLESSIAKQIEKFFAEILNRYPNNADLQDYLDMLESGKIMLGEIPLLLKNSEEFKILNNLQKVREGPIITKDGFTMYLDPSDNAVSGYVALYKTWEPFTTELMKKYLNENTNFIDIGAHIGYYSLFCASHAKNGRVIAFEPEEKNLGILRKNIHANNIKNITISDYAISDMNDTMIDFYLGGENNTGDNRFFPDTFRELSLKRNKVKIKTSTLDNFLKTDGMKPDLIKMDIQGGELLALKGMKHTIENSDKLLLFTEFWPRGILSNGGSPKEFLELLCQNGFNIYEISKKQTRLEKKPITQLVNENLIDSNPEMQTDLVCLKNIKI